jgi:hypothetical protein
LPEQGSWRAAEHLFEPSIAALDDAIAGEQDSRQRVVENDLMLAQQALAARFRGAPLGNVVDRPDGAGARC